MHNIYMEQFTSIVWCLVPENILDGSPGKGNRTTHIVYGKFILEQYSYENLYVVIQNHNILLLTAIVLYVLVTILKSAKINC